MLSKTSNYVPLPLCDASATLFCMKNLIKVIVFTLVSVSQTATAMMMPPGGGGGQQDPMAMMKMMGGGMPGAEQFSQLKDSFKALTTKIPSRDELLDRCETILIQLQDYNTEKNQPFTNRVLRIRSRLSPLPNFTSVEDLYKPRPEPTEQMRIRYDRHLRCLAALGRVNTPETAEEYSTITLKLIQRYDLIEQRERLMKENTAVRQAYAELCKSDQEKFSTAYEEQRSRLVQRINELTAKIIPLEVALTVDTRNWLETYGSTIGKLLACLTGVWAVRMGWQAIFSG